MACAIQQVGVNRIAMAKRIWFQCDYKAEYSLFSVWLQLAISRMNTKLQVFLFVVVLLASMVSVSESFAGGGEVGRKRSYLEQVKLQISKTIHLLTFSNYSGLNFASNLVIIRLTKSRNNYFTIDQDKIWFSLIFTPMKEKVFYNSIFIN